MKKRLFVLLLLTLLVPATDAWGMNDRSRFGPLKKRSRFRKNLKRTRSEAFSIDECDDGEPYKKKQKVPVKKSDPFSFGFNNFNNNSFNFNNKGVYFGPGGFSPKVVAFAFVANGLWNARQQGVLELLFPQGIFFGKRFIRDNGNVVKIKKKKPEPVGAQNKKKQRVVDGAHMVEKPYGLWNSNTNEIFIYSRKQLSYLLFKPPYYVNCVVLVSIYNVDSPGRSEKVTDSDLGIIGQFINLKVLRIYCSTNKEKGTSVTIDGLKKLENLKKLRVVSIGGTSDLGVTPIGIVSS